MRLSFICPTAYLKSFGSQGDFTLALSHLIDPVAENDYEKGIKALNLPILCDNGLFENHVPEPLEILIEKAIRIGATHFFAPDKLYDTKGTQKELDKAIQHLKKIKRNPKYRFEKDLKIAAVVQAGNSLDYLKQLIDFNNNPDVDMIGLSILSIPESFKEEIGSHDITLSRMYLLRKMLQLKRDWKPVHLLGLGNSYRDVEFAKKYCPFVVSNDTSSAFWNGIQGKRIEKDGSVEGGKTKVKVDFNFNSASEEQLRLVQENINAVNKLLK